MPECLGDARKAAGCELCYVYPEWSSSAGARSCRLKRRTNSLRHYKTEKGQASQEKYRKSDKGRAATKARSERSNRSKIWFGSKTSFSVGFTEKERKEMLRGEVD